MGVVEWRERSGTQWEGMGERHALCKGRVGFKWKRDATGGNCFIFTDFTALSNATLK